MEKPTNNIRIKDIAKLAGVSEGTVDRVLHNRGGVSEKNLEAIKKVLREMNYTPNLLARSLALKKHHKFAYLIPTFDKGEYWEKVDSGFSKAATEFSQYNVSIHSFFYNQYDAKTFQKAANEIIELKPDAVILSPIFKNETLKLISILELQSIPFAFIDSNIETLPYLSYFGQHSTQSGYISAKFLVNAISEKGKIVVVRTKRNGSVSNQTNNRYQGFSQYISENNLSSIELLNVEIEEENEKKNTETFNRLFQNHPDISGAIIFNSKAYVLAELFNLLGKTNVKISGYDALEKNVFYLNTGQIICLIGQRPEKQAYLTIKNISQKLIFNQSIQKDNFIPIDILIKENIDNYLSFID